MKAVYRVVAALLAALTVPALYFLNLIHYVIKLNVTDGFLNDNVTTQQLVNILTDFFRKSGHKPLGSHLAEALLPLKPSAIVTLVFAAIMLLMVLAVVICSAFTNARKTNLTFACVGAAATIGAMAAFNHMTALIINNVVPLSKILNAAMADSSSFLAGLGSFFGAGNVTAVFGDLVLLRLGSGFTATLILFSAIIAWTVAFLLVDMDPDAKGKKS